jgi:D-alanyl-D-alanine carboxypeptidase (penicillin-binding protein 5/6)
MIWGHKCHNPKEVASLTKIMTFMTALKLCKNMGIKAQHTMVRVSESSAKLSGTSANLSPGCYVSIGDLYYGMMLPSGNDAAATLAECLGALSYLNNHHDTSGLVEQFINDRSKKEQLSQIVRSVNQASSYFIYEMNRYAKELNVTNSVWCNAHGLNNK